MSLSLEDLQKMYPDGRRVAILPKTEESRAKVPDGVTEGVVREVVPRPAADEADRGEPTPERYGLRVEIEKPDGQIEMLILDIVDVEDPLPSEFS